MGQVVPDMPTDEIGIKLRGFLKANELSPEAMPTAGPLFVRAASELILSGDDLSKAIHAARAEDAQMKLFEQP